MHKIKWRNKRKNNYYNSKKNWKIFNCFWKNWKRYLQKKNFYKL